MYIQWTIMSIKQYEYLKFEISFHLRGLKRLERFFHVLKDPHAYSASSIHLHLVYSVSYVCWDMFIQGSLHNKLNFP